MQIISTFEGVLEVLGGHKGVAKHCKRPVQAVYNWQNRGGFFPPVLIRRIEKPLRKRKCKPDDRLFRIEAA